MPTYFRPARVDITEDGSGLPIALLVMISAAVLIGSAVVAVAAFILGHLLLIIGVAALLAGVGAGLLTGLRHYVIPREAGRPAQVRQAAALTPRIAARAVAQPRRAAIGAADQHVHIHLHGVSAEEVAEIIRRAGNARPAIEEDR